MDLFELNGRVVVNLTDAVKAFNEIQKEGQKTESKLSKFFSGVGKAAAATGKAIAVGIGAGATAMAGLTAKALQLGGELEQNMGGAESVFKELGGSIDKMSTTIITGYDEATGKAIKTTMSLEEASTSAYKNMGLSTSDYLATANKMGALFQGAGFETQEALDLSSSAMQRAADVASIMGIDTSAAMESIAGAAKGNFTMLDNLGVAMNDTTLNAYAMEKGIKKTTQQMTNQEKIGLAMEMFMEKTAYAAGNYAKENETLAGSLGTAKSALTNFLDGSGSVEDVVSSVSNLANVVVENLKEIIPRLAETLPGLMQEIGPMIAPLLSEILPSLIEGASSLLSSLAEELPGLIKILFEDVLPKVTEGFVDLAKGITSALFGEEAGAKLQELLEGTLNAITNTFNFLQENTWVLTTIAVVIGTITTAIGLYNAVSAIKAAMDAAQVTTIWGLVSAHIAQAAAAMAAMAPYVLIVAAIAAVIAIIVLCVKHWDEISAAAARAWEWIKETWNKVASWFNEKVIQPVLNFFSNLWNGIKNTWNGIKNTISNTVNSVKETISNVFNSVKNTVGNIFDSIKEKMSAPIQKARDTIKGIVDKIKGFFSGMNISFPKIKLPHFSIKPKGWSIGDLFQGSIPSLGIEWYAKAMKNPMLMTEPTVFGYDAATGRAKVGGEAGDEIVGGASTIMNMIRAAVADQNSAVAYYLQKLIDILASYFPQILESMERDVVLDSGAMVGAMVVPMNRALGKLSDRKDRGR